jgi:hypothetical protein
LDFRPEDMRSARTLIRELQEDGLLDELGFGVLQNAIAERLYPATTTIMTASRYLFFLPAIYEHLENKRTPSRKFEDSARELQNQLRDVLKQTEGERRGVIGYQAGKDLKRLPSNIYWNGMRRLGLFRRNWSESTYHTRLDQIYAESEPHEDDDGALHGGEEQALWDRERPTPTFLDAQGNFKPKTDFRLTRAEARDLLHRYETFFPDSLLTYLLRNRIPELQYPWDLPRPPASLDLVLRHARALSALAQGVTLHYYALLLEARGQRGLAVPEVNLEDAFERWHEEARPVLETWNIEQFLTLDFVADNALRPGDPTFLRAWRAEALARGDASTLFRSAKGRQLVRDREARVKPSKARLRFPSYLEAWNPAFLQQGPLGEYGLFYRHRIGQRFAREIIQGLGGGET